MKFYLLIFCLPLALISAEPLDDLKPADSPYRLKALSIYEKADHRWEEFQGETDWFLKTIPVKYEIENENDLEKSLHQKWSEEQKEFIQAFLEVQEKFLEFRDKLGYLFSLNGTGHYADCSSAGVSLEVTNWYTHYLENHLFPSNWEKTYLKSKSEVMVKPSNEPKK